MTDLGLERREWDSKASMLAYLMTTESFVVVGDDAEAPRSFTSYKLTPHTEVGIISSENGGKPEVSRLANGIVLIGHDSSLTWVDPAAGCTLASRQLVGAFFGFRGLPEQRDALVVHELGLLRVDGAGHTKWCLDTDIVEDARVESDRIILKLMAQEEPIVVEPNSGSVLHER